MDQRWEFAWSISYSSRAVAGVVPACAILKQSLGRVLLN